MKIKTDERLIQEVFDYWLTKDIIKHVKITDSMKRLIDDKIENFGMEKVLKVIDNYSEVFHDNSYFFTYKFTLARLMQNDQFNKFSDDGQHWENYIYRNQKEEETTQESIKDIEIDEDVEMLMDLTNHAYERLIKKLNKIPYSAYLKTDHWKYFRKQALLNANYKCQVCNNDEKELSVHHNNYKNRGRETFADVIVVCENCHKKIHKAV